MEHPSLTVSDEMVNSFMKFVRTKDGSLNQGPKGLSQIEDLADLAEEMDWGTAAQESLQQLRVAVGQEWVQQYSRKLAPYIKSALHRELVLAFQRKEGPAPRRTAGGCAASEGYRSARRPRAVLGGIGPRRSQVNYKQGIKIIYTIMTTK